MSSQAYVAPDLNPTPPFYEECLAIVQSWQENAVTAQRALQSLKALAQKAQSDNHLANEGYAYYLVAYVYHFMGNLGSSNIHYSKARKLFDRVGNHRRLAFIDINLGENYRYRGDFRRARLLYQKAYDVGIQLGNIRIKTIALANQGLTLISTQSYHIAQQNLRESLDLCETWDESQSEIDALRAEIYFGLAQVELALGQVQTAWQYAQESLNRATTSQSKHGIGLAYRILGDVATALTLTATTMPDMKNPDDYYRQALSIFREMTADAEVARTLFSHAYSLGKRKRLRRASVLFNEAMASFTRLGMTNDAANAAEAQLAII